MINTLTLIGTGLIGGSLALDLKKNRQVKYIIGIDSNAENLSYAKERQIIDDGYPHITAQAVNADIIVIATPVAATDAVMQSLANTVGSKTLITDVGSTKQTTLKAFARYLPEQLPHCIAAHPIAGSDRSGASAARFGLFEQKKIIICPHQTQHSGSLNTIQNLWQSVGGQIHLMDAQTHDSIFSAISHLPHLLAYAYMHGIASRSNKQQLLNFAATGFRDFTRIAASHPDIWADIALANRQSLLAELEQFQQEITQLRTLLAQNDRNGLYALFNEAKNLREQWQEST